MANEWVAPVVTGAVGIAGVAGTYYSGVQARRSAREQRDHLVQERTRTEKREAYVGLLEAVNHALRVVDDHDAPATPEARRAALADLALRREQVRLVSPPEVRTRARWMGEHLQALLQQADGVHFDQELSAALLAAMKKDLGYELASVDLEALEYTP